MHRMIVSEMDLRICFFSAMAKDTNCVMSRRMREREYLWAYDEVGKCESRKKGCEKRRVIVVRLLSDNDLFDGMDVKIAIVCQNDGMKWSVISERIQKCYYSVPIFRLWHPDSTFHSKMHRMAVTLYKLSIKTNIPKKHSDRPCKQHTTNTLRSHCKRILSQSSPGKMAHYIVPKRYKQTSHSQSLTTSYFQTEDLYWSNDMHYLDHTPNPLIYNWDIPPRPQCPTESVWGESQFLPSIDLLCREELSDTTNDIQIQNFYC